jgi:Tol biopolymer transport system component
MWIRITSIFFLSVVGLFLFSVIFVVVSEAQAPDAPTIAITTRGADANIWLVDADGANERGLLHAGGDQPLGLVWSPDGTKLAFHTKAGGNVDIYVVNADGQNLKRLTEHEAEDSSPHWHPSGQKLVFESNRDGNFEIYTMTAAGQVIENLTNDPGNDITPAWSPDARKIAFSGKRGKTLGDIFVMDADGVNPQNITNNRSKDLDPRWSPDGKQFIFTSERNGAGDIFLMDINGENQKQINFEPDPGFVGIDGAPIWSPDGKEVAYEVCGAGTCKILVIDPDKPQNRLVLAQPGQFNRSPAWFNPDFVVEFSVSPAGKRPMTWGWLKRVRRND